MYLFIDRVQVVGHLRQGEGEDGGTRDEAKGAIYGFGGSCWIENSRATHFGEIQGADLGSSCRYFMLEFVLLM
jgi:hypothetical protein